MRWGRGIAKEKSGKDAQESKRLSKGVESRTFWSRSPVTAAGRTDWRERGGKGKGGLSSSSSTICTTLLLSGPHLLNT